VVSANRGAQDAGVRAGELVSSFGPAIGGRGGGKGDSAQGSGTNPQGIDAAVDAVRARIADAAAS
jgi:alanyl-tRNA synthetase